MASAAKKVVSEEVFTPPVEAPNVPEPLGEVQRKRNNQKQREYRARVKAGNPPPDRQPFQGAVGKNKCQECRSYVRNGANSCPYCTAQISWLNTELVNSPDWLVCPRCGYAWHIAGIDPSFEVTQCPRCNYTVSEE